MFHLCLQGHVSDFTGALAQPPEQCGHLTFEKCKTPAPSRHIRRGTTASVSTLAPSLEAYDKEGLGYIYTQKKKSVPVLSSIVNLRGHYTFY